MSSNVYTKAEPFIKSKSISVRISWSTSKYIEVAEKLVPVKKIDASFFSKGGGNLGDDIAQTQRIYC